MRKNISIASLTIICAVVAFGVAWTPVGTVTTSAQKQTTPKYQPPFPIPSPNKINPDFLSAGVRMYFLGPQPEPPTNAPLMNLTPSFGTNVDAADPNEDVAGGQSESAIAVSNSGQYVMAAWNDASALYVAPSTELKASATGVGFSQDGGKTFKDLVGLPNNNANQQRFGDPSVVAVSGGRYFLIGSVYLPVGSCQTGFHSYEIAVTVADTSDPNNIKFSEPIVVANGGDLCAKKLPPDLALLDKGWLAYDDQSRTLTVSYSRIFLGLGGQSGLGQIEIVRAHVPADADDLQSSDFSAPILVWPEEASVGNDGAYVAVAPGGDSYIAWERNHITGISAPLVEMLDGGDSHIAWEHNQSTAPFNGNPYIYEHVALVRASDNFVAVGGPDNPRVVTEGQVNSDGMGGVKSLEREQIPGYNRPSGNDFPRIAVDGTSGVVVVWNDASLHPLGDIWLRFLPPDLTTLNAPSRSIHKVNDDDSFALHFLPAVSVRSDGSIATSWYDRRLWGPDSTKTDYFGEIRPKPYLNGTDFRITTGETDWLETSSIITPNFGDYTDNKSVGKVTYYTWTDGRLGVAQPFVDKH